MKFKLESKNPEPLRAAQRRRLAALAAIPDSAIDYAGIAQQRGPVKWTRPGALVPSDNKQQITLRPDSDVAGFFKATGRHYQSRIDAALHEYIKAHGGSGSPIRAATQGAAPLLDLANARGSRTLLRTKHARHRPFGG